jgi:hypothetical protein
VTKTPLRQIPRNACQRNKNVTCYAPTCFLLRQKNFSNTLSGLAHMHSVTISLAGAVRSSLLGSRNVTALFPRGVFVTPGSERREMCRSSAAAISAHHPRIDNTQHDREDLIRPACELASKPSQLIPAEQWPLGFAARVVHSLALIRRTRTAGNAMAYQRTRQALCRLVMTAIADTVQTHEGVLRDNAAFKGLSCNRPHDGKSREGLHARGNDRTAGETYEAGEMPGLSWGPLSDLRGVGGKTGSLGINDLSSLFRVSSVQILAAAFPEKSGLPSLKPFRLGDLSSPWNAPRWPSGLRGFVFPVGRYPGAAEHKSRSVTPLWLRGGW